ncbi:MAG: Asp-tRNA(Asn)/Glu-tRNA(Gln) amidotransferase subunit GatC [Acidobacteriota bacterium]
MKITEAEVRYVAELANLHLSEEETARFCAELGEILTYMDKLNELDTAAVEPMAQVLYEAGEAATLREDCERPGLGSETALANAPLAGAGHYKVPKVIER